MFIYLEALSFARNIWCSYVIDSWRGCYLLKTFFDRIHMCEISHGESWNCCALLNKTAFGHVQRATNKNLYSDAKLEMNKGNTMYSVPQIYHVLRCSLYKK